MKLILPWFDKTLNPNIKKHWAVIARARKNQRKDAFRLAKEAGTPDTFDFDIIFYPPNNHRRDEDNCIAALKGAFDGMADAWGVDDSVFHINSIRLEEADKPGRVEIVTPTPVHSDTQHLQ